MRDDADDVDADGAEHNVGDNDGLFFSLAWRRQTGTCPKERGARSMREGETARGRYAKPHFHHPLAYLLVVQAMGVRQSRRRPA